MNKLDIFDAKKVESLLDRASVLDTNVIDELIKILEKYYVQMSSIDDICEEDTNKKFDTIKYKIIEVSGKKLGVTTEQSSYSFVMSFKLKDVKKKSKNNKELAVGVTNCFKEYMNSSMCHYYFNIEHKYRKVYGAIRINIIGIVKSAVIKEILTTVIGIISNTESYEDMDRILRKVPEAYKEPLSVDLIPANNVDLGYLKSEYFDKRYYNVAWSNADILKMG